MQEIVDQAREDLTNDPSIRDRQLTVAERKAENRLPFLKKINNGKAMERYVGDLAEHYVHPIGKFGGLDYQSVFSDFELELTTDNPFTKALHLRRPGVSDSNLLTYTNWTPHG